MSRLQTPDSRDTQQARHFPRRRLLRVTLGVGVALIGVEAGWLGSTFLSPSSQFKTLTLTKTDYPAALPSECSLRQGKGIFYLRDIFGKNSYLIHLAKETPWQVQGDELINRLDHARIIRDGDGSYWFSFTQQLPLDYFSFPPKVHFVESEQIFVEPIHGSIFSVVGDWLQGWRRDIIRVPVTLGQHTVTLSSDVHRTPQYIETVNHPSDHYTEYNLLAYPFRGEWDSYDYVDGKISCPDCETV